MHGELDPVYIAARKALLDALEALDAHRAALILVGAQAIYHHTGDAEVAVAEFTDDGDIAIDPNELRPDPRLEDALRDAGFSLDLQNPGIWFSQDQVEIDLLVPEALGGAGRRGARLGEHGKSAARKVRGLEAALVDVALATLAALDEEDSRVFDVRVAGPSALLVAKLHKLGERVESPNRMKAKDAHDILRLLRGVEMPRLIQTTNELLVDNLAGEVTREAREYLSSLFGSREGRGSNLAAQAAAGLEDPDTVRASCEALASDLLEGTRP